LGVFDLDPFLCYSYIEGVYIKLSNMFISFVTSTYFVVIMGTWFVLDMFK